MMMPRQHDPVHVLCELLRIRVRCDVASSIAFRNDCASTACGNDSFVANGLAFGNPEAIARGPQDRFYVVSGETASQIDVYGPTGAFVSSIGRDGAGPGEFGSILQPVGSEDSRDGTVVRLDFPFVGWRRLAASRRGFLGSPCGSVHI
jgi:hypothetical protein